MCKMEKFANENPIHRDSLLLKVKMQREKYELIKDAEQFQKLIDTVDIILTDIESHLKRESSKLTLSDRTMQKITSKNRFCFSFIIFLYQF